MPIRGILLLLLALMGSFVLAQGTEVPGALQFTRTVNLPLSRAQVAALVNATTACPASLRTERTRKPTYSLLRT